MTQGVNAQAGGGAQNRSKTESEADGEESQDSDNKGTAPRPTMVLSCHLNWSKGLRGPRRCAK